MSGTTSRFRAAGGTATAGLMVAPTASIQLSCFVQVAVVLGGS